MNNYFKKIPNVEFALFLMVANQYVTYDSIARKLNIGKDVISKYAASVYDDDDVRMRPYAKHAGCERQEEIIEIILETLEELMIDRILAEEEIDDIEGLIARCFSYLIPNNVLKSASDEQEAMNIIFDINDVENSYGFNFISRAIDDWNNIKDKNLNEIIWFDDNFDLIFNKFRCDIELIQSECYKSINPNFSVAFDKVLLDSDGCIKSFECLDMAINQNQLKKESKLDIGLDKDRIDHLKRSIIRKAVTYYMYRSRPYNDNFDEYASYIIEKSPEALEYPLYHDFNFADFFDEVMSIDGKKWFEFARFRLYLDQIL